MHQLPEPSARWTLIERLFHEAMQKPRQERAAFLDAACGHDSALRGELDSLLAHDGALDSLLENQPLGGACQPPPELGAGAWIGPYRIIELLGTGGMGDVYRAHDPRLGRDVAIKVAAEQFSDRFSSEVRAIAALSHPHICQVYDVGPNYLVMESCAGETLATRLTRGKLSVPEVVDYGVQLADALSAAHAKNIVHRDLKPANVMLTRTGLKLLDFGVAKQLDSPTPEQSPAVNRHIQTEPGATVGTAAYMSPEQAQGIPIDARSDVFSFGAVLYEMVTGVRAFQGGSRVSTLSAVANQEPAPIDASVPDELRKIISRCLRKNAATRLQHMGDIKILLEELRGDAKLGSGDISPPATPPRTANRSWWTASIVLLLAALSVTFLFTRFASRLDSGPRALHLTSYRGFESAPSLSPDGSQVAFSWNGEKQDNADIYVKLVSGGPPLRLTNNPLPDHGPAWSPDGTQIAFIRAGFIYLISPLGGPERKLTRAARSLSWSPDGRFLAFSDGGPDSSPPSIYIVSSATGERRKVTSPRVGVYGGDPQCAYSPDGKSLAFIRHLNAMASIYLLPLSNNAPSGEPRLLTRQQVNAVGLAWMPDAREIVYASARGGRSALWRLALSPGAQPSRLPGTEEATLLSVSRGPSPRLAYMRPSLNWNIWQADIAPGGVLAAPPRPIIESTGVQSDPQFSPGGERIAFMSDRSDHREIWIADRDGANPVQLTNFAGTRTAGAPRWSPDGSQIAFDSTDGTHWDIFVISADGGAPRRLTDGTSSFVRPSWSQDGRWIYFASDPSGDLGQIWKMPSAGGRALQVTSSGGRDAFESYDGKTLYFSRGFSTPGILSMPAHGGPESLLIRPGRPGFWAVSENGILFLDFDARTGDGPTPLKFFNFATRQTAQLGSLAKVRLNKLNTLSVSRDGRRAIWCQQDRAESDLMILENFR